MEPLYYRLADDPATENGVLAGSTDGRHALGRLISQASKLRGGVIVLDFAGIATATASFLRESVVAFRNYCTNQPSPASVVLSNVGPRVEDELEFLASSLRDVYVICQPALGRSGSWSCRLVGQLDAKQDAAYVLVIARGQTTATELAETSPERPKVGVTAWNNRLAALRDKGLVLQAGLGKTKLYVPVEEALNGK